MITVRDIADFMETIAPRSLAEEWDNVGLLAGSFRSEVKKIMICLDLDFEAISEAIAMQANLIITHHPILLQPVRRITDETAAGQMIQRLIKHDISMFAAHTNLDTADGGLNDILANTLGLCNVRKLFTPDFSGSARMGEIKKQTLGDFLLSVKEALNSPAIKYIGDKSELVQTAGVCSGSGGFMITGAKQSGCDVLVVGEAKYSDEQLAAQLGLSLIEAGHFETENIFCAELKNKLQSSFNNIQVTVSKRKTTYYKYYE